jgi:Ca-activated chloride channel family protein
MLRFSVCVLLAAACLAQFRSEVHLINVGFSVRDAQGKLVTSLTQNDFEIVEDGMPQKIAFFARSQDVPLNLGLVVDISGSQGAFVKQHHQDVRKFLSEVLRKDDRAFLVCFANNPRLVATFTSSGKQLVDALEGFQTLRDKSPYPLLGFPEIRTGGTSFYDALFYSSAQMLGTVESGRKALVIFSDGEDNASAHHEMDAIEAAQTNDVLLFSIRYTEVHNGRPNARNKYGTSVMERLSRETGGADFDAREKELADHFKEIGDQLRMSYELGYHSSNPVTDDSFHKIKIRLNSSAPPGLTVRSKTGYYAKTSDR